MRTQTTEQKREGLSRQAAGQFFHNKSNMILYAPNTAGMNRGIFTEETIRKVVSLFSLDRPADDIAAATGIARKVIDSMLREIRKQVAARCLAESPLEKVSITDIELDSNLEVLGAVRSNNKVYLEPIPGLKREVLELIAKRENAGRSVIEAMGLHTRYCGLIAIQGGCYLDMENDKDMRHFWEMVSERARQSKNEEKADAYLLFKECEFKHNYPYWD